MREAKKSFHCWGWSFPDGFRCVRCGSLEYRADHYGHCSGKRMKDAFSKVLEALMSGFTIIFWGSIIGVVALGVMFTCSGCQATKASQYEPEVFLGVAFTDGTTIESAQKPRTYEQEGSWGGFLGLKTRVFPRDDRAARANQRLEALLREDLHRLAELEDRVQKFAPPELEAEPEPEEDPNTAEKVLAGLMAGLAGFAAWMFREQLKGLFARNGGSNGQDGTAS